MHRCVPESGKLSWALASSCQRESPSRNTPLSRLRMNPKESNKAELPNFVLVGAGHNHYGTNGGYLKRFSLIDPFHWGGGEDVSLF